MSSIIAHKKCLASTKEQRRAREMGWHIYAHEKYKHIPMEEYQLVCEQPKKKNLAWWSYYPKLQPHQEQLLGPRVLRSTKETEAKCAGLSCLLYFSQSFSMEKLLQTYLAASALQAENKAHIIHAAQDKMERRGHYEGGSALVYARCVYWAALLFKLPLFIYIQCCFKACKCIYTF